MSARVLEHATYEDLVKAPDNLVAELIEGELYTSPRPAPRHARAESALGFLLGPPFAFGRGGPGGWVILVEPEIHFDANALVPDLAGWRIERMPELPTTAYYTVVPDWVCEVLSRSTAPIDRLKKLPIYARHGVQYAWLVDVERQLLEVKRLENGKWLEVATVGGQDTVRLEPFEAIEIDLTLIWGPAPA